MKYKRLPWVTLGLSLLAVAIYLAPGGAEGLELSRAGLRNGELWRLVGGHLAHWSRDHLVWDVATFAGVGVLCEMRSRRDTVLVLALAAPAISLGVLAAYPELASYRGLSALDIALYVLLAAQIGGRLGAGLATLLVGKLAFEGWTGSALFVPPPPGSVALVPVAHGVGGLVAGLFVAWPRPGGLQTPRNDPAIRRRSSRTASAPSRSTRSDRMAASRPRPQARSTKLSASPRAVALNRLWRWRSSIHS